MALSSGVLLQTLAGQYSLKGRYAEALMLSSRAVAAHPAFVTARYRMAVSASLLCEALEDTWCTLPISQREQVEDAVKRALDAIGADPIEIRDAQAAAQGNPDEPMRDLAKALFTRLERAWAAYACRGGGLDAAKGRLGSAGSGGSGPVAVTHAAGRH